MNQKEILMNVFKRLEPRYNKINFVFSVILLVTGIMMVLRPGFLMVGLLDLSFCIIGFIMNYFRNRIRLQWKVMMTLALLYIFSIQSLIRGGFLGNGLLALAMIIVISFSFLDKEWAFVIALMSVGVVVTLTICIYLGVFDLNSIPTHRYVDKMDWFLQSVTIMLFLVITYFCIYSIRTLLLDSISKLNQTVEELQDKSTLLNLQQEQLKYLAYHDVLTNLTNRNYFEQVLPKEKKASNGEPSILAILDIRDFKNINSFYGTSKGDLLLQVISQVMDGFDREYVTVSRIGGNEFGLLGVGWTKEALENYIALCVQEINRKISEMGILNKYYYIMTYTTFKFQEDRFHIAFRNASIAMKYAKEHQLNGLIGYEENMLQVFEKETRLISLLGLAMENDEFVIFFQAKVDSSTNKVIGYEALARWESKELGMISPVVFIPLINKSNHMAAFTEHIILKIIQDFECIQEKVDYELSLSINVSPIFFMKDFFEAYIVEAIQKSKIHFNQVILEITEDIFISELEEVNRKVGYLQSKGIKISMDDFGTGYSSLNYLKQINFDEIKIDRSFITNIETDERTRILLKVLITAAKLMQCDIVAEGVETLEQLNEVSALGCTIIQGYYYAKPMPKEMI